MSDKSEIAASTFYILINWKLFAVSPLKTLAFLLKDYIEYLKANISTDKCSLIAVNQKLPLSITR
jgi:hypothetical protein